MVVNNKYLCKPFNCCNPEYSKSIASPDCAVAVPVGMAPDIGLNDDDVFELLRANIDMVDVTLSKLDKILITDQNYNSTSPFATVTETKTQKSFIHLVMEKYCWGQYSDDYKPAMERILSHLEKRSKETALKRKLIADLLDMQDSEFKRTILHEASEQWGNEVVKRLLDLGANINLSDDSGELAVTKINPDVLEKVLDSKWAPENRDPIQDNDHDKEYKISFDFAFLLSPLNHVKPLVALSQSSTHRHLLTHPVITTYLHTVWRKMSLWYNLYTFFTIIICLLLNLFILANYGGNSVVPLSSNQSEYHRLNQEYYQHDVLSQYFRGGSKMGWLTCCLLTLIVVMLFKELIQLAVAILSFQKKMVKEHFKDIENWMEAYFIISTIGLIIYTSDPIYTIEEPLKPHLRALAATILLVSWILCLNMVARNPRFHKQNVHITMFFKVTRKFIKMFFMYTPYIVAFGLFFYISMAKDFAVNKDVKSIEISKISKNISEKILDAKEEVLEEIKKDGDFFDNFFFSILKTLIMFVGELDFSDIPFDNNPIFSHIFFVIFVFIIVIVLMNLLTGIAVDEISDIQKNAEVSIQVMRVKAIWQMEKFYSLMKKFYLWCRSKNTEEKKDEQLEEEVQVNEPCVCKFFVCTCGSEDYWRTELLMAVKKRRSEQEEKSEQQNWEQKMKKDQENWERKMKKEQENWMQKMKEEQENREKKMKEEQENRDEQERKRQLEIFKGIIERAMEDQMESIRSALREVREEQK